MTTDPYLPVRVDFRVSREQYAAMVAAADERNMTLATWVRMVTNAEAYKP